MKVFCIQEKRNGKENMKIIKWMTVRQDPAAVQKTATVQGSRQTEKTENYAKFKRGILSALFLFSCDSYADTRQSCERVESSTHTRTHARTPQQRWRTAMRAERIVYEKPKPVGETPQFAKPKLPKAPPTHHRFHVS